MQVAVTYEIDPTLHEVVKMEFTFLEWLSLTGGLSSILFVASQSIGSLDDTSLFVLSALMSDQQTDDS